ncbi:ankyrin repeat domain-containing protein [Chitinibacteraceae bacterium HSL-7]
MSDALRACLEQHQLMDFFPKLTVERYPRIIERVVELWGSDALAAYFDDLLIMDRPDRQGFPPEVGLELMELALAHERTLKASGGGDVWGHVRESARAELEAMGLAANARDFHQAIGRGDEALVKLFLSAGLTANQVDDHGFTPLIRAATDGNVALMLLLERAGGDLHRPDRDGYGPLHWAALNGREPVCHFLLKRGVAVNLASKHGFTALIQAASSGYASLVKQLIESGAQVNVSTDEGWTALHKAVANRHAEAAIVLIDHGADLDARHADGSTPYQMAMQQPALRTVMDMARRLRQRLARGGAPS